MPHRLKTPSNSVLGCLRAVIPTHDQITFSAALHIAELQANRLLELRGIDSAPTPDEIISYLPKITVALTSQPVSGASYWDAVRKTWVIHLSRADSYARRRFTLAHEYKHIIDHGSQTRLYRGSRRDTPQVQAERAADYFAGCLLVPKRLLKQAWGYGIQTTGELAELFDVSEQAIGVRLRQTGLVAPTNVRHLPAHLSFPSTDDSPVQLDDELPDPIDEGALSA